MLHEIAIFNVNGSMAVFRRYLAVAEEASPDVMCVQELKAPEARAHMA